MAAAVDGHVDGSAVTTEASSSPPKTFRLGNRPPLTGVRALCMIPVVVYHSDFHTLPGAWARSRCSSCSAGS